MWHVSLDIVITWGLSIEWRRKGRTGQCMKIMDITTTEKTSGLNDAVPDFTIIGFVKNLLAWFQSHVISNL